MLPPCDVEPNTFYEPRTATAPFVIICEASEDCFFPYFGEGDTIESFDTRAEAEERAREAANGDNFNYYVLGVVSISSVPSPLKASTRALV